jgi:hypothetical protein
LVEPVTNQLPLEVSLQQNHPNPFNPSTTISYQLPGESRVMLRVFDVLGREVRTLVDGTEGPGYKSVQFDAGGLASGMYLYRLEFGSFVETRTMILLK